MFSGNGKHEMFIHYEREGGAPHGKRDNNLLTKQKETRFNDVRDDNNTAGLYHPTQPQPTKRLTHPASLNFPAKLSFMAMWRKHASTLSIKETHAALTTQHCVVLHSLSDISSSFPKWLVNEVKFTTEQRIRATQYWKWLSNMVLGCTVVAFKLNL